LPPKGVKPERVISKKRKGKRELTVPMTGKEECLKTKTKKEKENSYTSKKGKKS